MKYPRMFSVAAVVAVVAGSGAWGASHPGGSAGAKPPVVTANAANAASETCTGTSTVDGPGPGQKANVSLCALIGGQSVTVKFNADCFSAFGATQIPTCVPRGYWSLEKGKTLVASGSASGSSLYPGPGTYTLTASVNVTAEVPNAGFTAYGEISHGITLDTAIPPGPRLDGGTNRAGGTLTVTVTNVGDKPATGVKLSIGLSPEALERAIQLEIAITKDKRCSDDIFISECALGSLAAGASASVELASGTNRLCAYGTTAVFHYSYTADGFDPFDSLGGSGPC